MATVASEKRSSSTAAAAGQAALAPMYWPSKRWPSSILATKTADVASRLVCSRLELAKRAGDASFARNYASLRLLSLLRWSNVDDYDSCVDLKPLGIASQGLEPEQCSSRQHLSAAKRGDLVLLDKI